MTMLSTEEIEKRIADSYELPNNVLQKVPEPLVSVRTSTYNHGKYIKACIEGVLMQKTTFPIEFIIGEDCSTDETREIVFGYAKRYPDIIRVITADYNVGSKANGRRCIRVCRGKYMAICEGDDYWTDPYKLQKQVDFLEGHPEYGLVYAKAKYFNQKQQKFEGVLGKDYISFENLLRENIIPTLTVMLRKSLIFQYYNEIDVSKMGWKMGDYPLWLWVAERSKLYFINDVVAVYRALEESASHSKSVERSIQFYKSRHDIQSFFALRNDCMNLLPWIDECYYVDVYQLCLVNSYAIPDNCLYYFKEMKTHGFKGKWFKRSINCKILKFILKSYLKSSSLRKLKGLLG